MKRPPIYYAAFPFTPLPRRISRFCWEWEIADGMTGPVLASGTATTYRGALRARIRAELRCRPESERPQAEREQMRLDEICARLHEQGIEVVARYDEKHRVCVSPVCPCSNRDHRRVMREFYAVVGPVRWEVTDGGESRG